MNMHNEFSMDQQFGGPAPFNWDFNFAMDPVASGQLGREMPMDIEAWSSVLVLLRCDLF
jgi:hypothetical protein